MVEDTGKALHVGTYKPINTPEPVVVKEDASGHPVRLSHHRAIVAIEDQWRIDDEWWRSEPVSRLYLRIRLASGEKLVLYKDLITGNWYRQQY